MSKRAKRPRTSVLKDVSQPDHCTREGAEALAAKATKFWHDQGFITARFWVGENCMGTEHRPIYTVLSNLVNGLPPPSPPLSRSVATKAA